MDNIFCTTAIISRGRKDRLKICIKLIYDLAKYKNNLEILVRLDEDDIESISLFDEEYFKQIKNLQVYVGQRVGYEYLGKLWAEMFKIGKGEILIPVSDDYLFKLKDWDEFYYNNFKDKSAIIGSRCRFVLTRKIFENDEYINNFAMSEFFSDKLLEDPVIKRIHETMNYTNRSIQADHRIFRYSIMKNLFISSQRLYRIHDIKDVTEQEGSCGGWKLQDKTILHNLTWNRIK